MKFRITLVLALFLAAFASCKKDGPNPDADKEILLRDSTYYYSLVLSLWTDKIPEPKMKSKDEIDLRAFTGNLSTAEQVLDKVKSYTTLDRFSFIDREGVVGEEIGQGLHKEFGLVPDYFSPDQTAQNAKLYIKLVQKNSPAEAAGIVRGMEVLSIDGNSKIDYTTQKNQGFALVNKLFGGSEKISLQVKNPADGKVSTVNLNAASYQIDPIIANKVVERGGKKVGYLAYTSFVEVLTKTGTTSYYNGLVQAVKNLESQGIQELVVDLRYNGGGSTNAAELLTNLLAPTKVGTGVMYSYKINEYLKGWGWDNESNPEAPFRSVKFNKENSLNLSKIYFLVTKSTASASELLMNSLIPHMQVEIISQNDAGSYGKPVGFFGLGVVDDYAELYITSFQTLNSDGNGDYFNGLSGTKKNSTDDIHHALGDPNERMFADALYHIVNKTYQSASASTRRSSTGQVIRPKAFDIPMKNDVSMSMFKFANDKDMPQIK